VDEFKAAGVKPQLWDRSMTMDIASLSPLFAPRVVAVIGASTDPLKIGGRPISYLKAKGFGGRIIPVNPKAKEIQGLPVLPAITDVDGEVDLAICAVPGEHALTTLEDCARKGVRAVIMFSAGFAEVGADGKVAQDRLAAIAREAGMRLMGPNCMGVANLSTGMIASFHPVFGFELPAGRIGLVSQSGAFGGLCMQMARERGVGFSYMITTGNEADVQASDALAYLAVDKETAVIMLYLEGCRDGAGMLEALELLRRNGKPVVAIKLGRTDVGAKAAQSHTAALAGADAVFDAVFRQYGVYRASNIEEFFDVGIATAIGCLPRNNKVGLITVSGGVGVLMADDAAARGLDVAELPAATQAKFKRLVPFAGVRNPLDVTGQIINDRSLLERAAALVLGECDYGSVVCYQGSSASDPQIAKEQLAVWLRIKQAFPDRLITISGLLSPEFQKGVEAAGMPTARDPTHSLRAIAALHRFATTFALPFARPRVAPAKDKLGRGNLNEVDAMAVLARAGLPVVEERLVTSAEAAVAAAATLGYPVVMKVVSADIPHKTDVGGVRLKLADGDAVSRAFDGILRDVGAAAPAAKIDGCLVAPMIGGNGVETIIGVTSDALFGPVVMFGLGGVLVEALGDVVFRVAPFDEAEAHRMIREIRAYRVLAGVRGAPPSDVAALAEALAALSRFAFAYADQIVSVEANPFLVRPNGQGAIALDAIVATHANG
jgi:acetate---CoA ligase (ADP-forming)